MIRIISSIGRDVLRCRSMFEPMANIEVSGILIEPRRSRHNMNRHRDPKYRLERSRKVWKLDLPDFDLMRREQTNLSPEEQRSKLKEKGVAPPNVWTEREFYNSCTMDTIEPYNPSGDGKSSSLIDRLKSPTTAGKDIFKNRKSLSEIRNFEGPEFNLKDFATNSVEIYVKAHQKLADQDHDGIFDYVTEYCYPLMTAGLTRKTVEWNYLGNVEEPRVVQVRAADQLSKGNKYAQITVRLHTKQKLAVYDRHGRLILGSPSDVKDVLEFVVFEKYLANEYGQWRVHNRIRHSDEPVSQRISKTFVVAQS